MSSDSDRFVVFDVQRFCVHDGPGIRTVVFLKGCSLRCQNPESLRAKPEIANYGGRCVRCGRCVEACPEDAIDGWGSRFDRSRCIACGSCVEACPYEARRLVGRRLTPEELLNEVLTDKPYFVASGGGVTLSGGEPLMQARRLAPFLELWG